MAKKYFPQMALGFDDPRVQVHKLLLPDCRGMAKDSAAAYFWQSNSEPKVSLASCRSISRMALSL